MSEQTKVEVPDRLRTEVTALTLSSSYAPVPGRPTDPEPAGLRPHPGPALKGTTVWVHGSGGFWRPAVVLRESKERAGKPGKVRVVHSVPSNPTRMYVKHVPLEDLRVKA